MIAHTRKTPHQTGRPLFGLASLPTILFLTSCLLLASAKAQTDCSQGNGLLDMTPLKNLSAQELISKFGAAESKVKQARQIYTFTEDVLIQTLTGASVNGQSHDITTVSYDAKGRRLENVTYAEQSTLRFARLTQSDMDDIRVFMPLILTTEDLPQYNVTYAGQQRVDDLDTYVFHVEPKKEEQNRRYFQGRIWVDIQDLQIVKLCGKSVPEEIHASRNQRQDLRPTFVTYRQQVDGYWFPAYTRVDDTLNFQTRSVRLHEVIKFTGYKRAATGTTLSGTASAGTTETKP